MESRDFRPDPFTEREAYLWSIEQAAHKPHRQWFNGSQYEIRRGEFVTSLHAMMATFGWSEKRVRLFVGRMEKREKWAKRGAHRGAKAPTVLTVLNYDEFQRPPREWGEGRGEPDGEPGAKQGRSKGEEQKEGINNGKEGEIRERAPALPYPDALSIWSEAAERQGWEPKEPKLTDKRRAGLSKILKTHGLDGWRAGIERAEASELLGKGQGPPTWWNFNFVTNPEKFQNLIEGNYDRAYRNGSAQRESAWGAAFAAGSPGAGG